MAVDSQVKEITERLEQGVKGVFTSETYMDYLKTMSRFHSYSTRNTLLIHMQMPWASRVAGFRAWQDKFKRQVKKGEKSIKIFAPAPFVIREEHEQLDPETDIPVIDENGMPIIEQKERRIARFKVASVFDISQTEGEPLPSLMQDLTGDVKQFEAFVDALKAVSPLPIEFESLSEDTDGYCLYGERIAVREGMSEVQTVCAIVHEIAHAKLHDRTLSATEDIEQKSLRTKEIEAESVSYAVCQYFGIETGVNSFGYLAEWSKNKETKELIESLDTIRSTATELIDSIEARFQEIAKERGIDFEIDTIVSEPEQSVPLFSESPAGEENDLPILNEYSKVKSDYTIGSNVLLMPVFNDGNFNREGKKIRVTVEEPAGKYQLFSREEHGNKVLYFMTASGRIDATAWYFRDNWDEDLRKWVNHRPTEEDFDELIPKVAEQFEHDMLNPNGWAKYQHAAVVNRLDDCERHNAPVRKQREEESKQRKAAGELERQEEKRRQQERYDARIDDIAVAIQMGNTISVGHDEYEFEGKNPVLDLFKLYGINLPLRTQGWVKTGLAEITESSYRYYSSKHKGDSTTFSSYLRQLREAIRLTPIKQLRERNTVPDTADKEAKNTVENQLYRDFAEMFPKVISGEYRYLRLESEGFEPLSIEWISDDTISIMHTYTMNGDLMYDPMVSFTVDHDEKTMTAVEYELSLPPVYQRVYENGDGQSVDGNGNQRTIPNLRSQINEFAQQWFKNIKDQHFLPVRANLAIDDDVIQITFDEDGKPIMPELELPDAEAIEQKLHRFFTELFPQFMSGEYTSMRLTGENSKPLVLKRVSDDIITISHDYEINGEPAFEPLVALNVNSAEKTLTARSMVVTEPPTCDVVYSTSGTPDYAMQQRINNFTAQWIEVLGEHGFKAVEATIDVDGKDVHITFDEHGKPIMPETVTPEIEAPSVTPASDEADLTDLDIVFPDPSIGFSEMNLFGYTWDGMLPLTQKRALELFDTGHTIYRLYPDNTEAMLDDRNEIQESHEIYGIELVDWEKSPEYANMGHSMSVSDVMVMKRDGNISSYYVDSGEFSELSAFLGVETPKTQEQGYSGPTVAELREAAKSGKPISLSDLQKAMQAEKEQARMSKQPPSLLERLEDAKQNVTPPNSADTQKNNEREV